MCKGHKWNDKYVQCRYRNATLNDELRCYDCDLLNKKSLYLIKLELYDSAEYLDKIFLKYKWYNKPI